MKRHIRGLHLEPKDGDGLLEGLFVAGVDRGSCRWHP
jgi:hypothetical protein